MSDFEREERYIVIKRKYLDEASESALLGVIHGLDLPTEECVVVEHDWPNYDATWRSVQQVAEGTYDPDQLTRLQSEVERLRGRCEDAETENERVRQANLDVMMHFDDMKAEKEKAEARVAELEGQRIIYNVGICDANYPVTKQEIVDGKKKQSWVCPFYRTWRNMIARCYREREHEHRPGYKGCTVCSEWHRFSAFKAWMDKQDWLGKHLDKDLMVPGNKIYSPETCAFISQDLNSFLIDRSAKRGEHPLGVSWHKAAKKFKAQCKNPFTKKQESLGFFEDSGLAHEAWRKRKHELACKYAETVSDSRVSEALRSRYAQRLRQKADEAEKAGG